MILLLLLERLTKSERCSLKNNKNYNIIFLKRDDGMINKTEQRKKQIIVTAMKLFSDKGYEQTSMRDIARALGVSLGLCYRYFDSKQVLFNCAIDYYIEDCCNLYLKILHDPKIKIKEKIDILFDSIGNEHTNMQYYNFFHRIENSELHEQLSLKLCKYMYPHLLEEIKLAISKDELNIQNPDILVSFITYGQIGLLSKSDIDHHKISIVLKEYVNKLLAL